MMGQAGANVLLAAMFCTRAAHKIVTSKNCLTTKGGVSEVGVICVGNTSTRNTLLNSAWTTLVPSPRKELSLSLCTRLVSNSQPNLHPFKVGRYTLGYTTTEKIDKRKSICCGCEKKKCCGCTCTSMSRAMYQRETR